MKNPTCRKIYYLIILAFSKMQAPPRFYAIGDLFVRINRKEMERIKKYDLLPSGVVIQTLSTIVDFKLNRKKNVWVYKLEHREHVGWGKQDFFQLIDMGNGDVMDENRNEWSLILKSRKAPKYERKYETEKEVEFFRGSSTHLGQPALY